MSYRDDGLVINGSIRDCIRGEQNNDTEQFMAASGRAQRNIHLFDDVYIGEVQ